MPCPSSAGWAPCPSTDVDPEPHADVGRARIRTSSKIVLAVTLGTMAMIYLTSDELLEVYDTWVGQLWLFAVFALFVVSLALTNHFARIELPERFSARRTGSRIDLGRLR